MSEGDGQTPPEVDFRIDYQAWPTDRPFPLTPLEAWYVMRGYAVRPSQPMSLEVFLELPGQLELSDGYVMLRQT